MCSITKQQQMNEIYNNLQPLADNTKGMFVKTCQNLNHIGSIHHISYILKEENNMFILKELQNEHDEKLQIAMEQGNEQFINLNMFYDNLSPLSDNNNVMWMKNHQNLNEIVFIFNKLFIPKEENDMWWKECFLNNNAKQLKELQDEQNEKLRIAMEQENEQFIIKNKLVSLFNQFPELIHMNSESLSLLI